MKSPSRTPSRPRVLIADDHVIVAEGLAFALAPYFDIVGMVHELDRIAGAIAGTRPTVILLDLSFGGHSALSVLRGITEDRALTVHAIVLTAHESSTLSRAAKEAGALSMLLKGVSTQELRLAVEAAAEGRSYIARPARERRGGTGLSVRRRRREIDGVSLTDRQAEILLMLSEGSSRTAIAKELSVTVKGVDFLLRQVKDATGLEEIVQLVAWGIEHKRSLREVCGE